MRITLIVLVLVVDTLAASSWWYGHCWPETIACTVLAVLTTIVCSGLFIFKRKIKGL